MIGDFATVNLPGCINGTICFFGFADHTLDSYFIRTFDLSMAVGGDFDGSGLVDELDLNIWRQHLGEMGAPGTLPGDANGDGVVDGTDFLIWQNQFGTPGMAVPGAGAGSLAAVPEPASLAMLLGGTLLALAIQRRRQS